MESDERQIFNQYEENDENLVVNENNNEVEEL